MDCSRRALLADRRTLRGLIAGAAAVIAAHIPPSRAAGQPLPNPSHAAWFTFAPGFNAQLVCGTINVSVVGEGISSGNCSAHGATYSAYAEVNDGVAKVRAAVAGTNLPGSASGNASWTSSSAAWWRDRLTVTSGAVAELELSLHWTGSLAADVSHTGMGIGAAAEATALWNFQAFGPGFGRLMPDYNGRRNVYARADVGGAQSAAISDLQTFRFSLIGSSGLVPFVDLAYNSWMIASLNDFLTGPTQTFSGAALADMSNTARITSLVFRDAAGADITNSVTYRFANGTVVYPIAAVPEPGTWVLLSTGLVVIGVLRRIRGPV